MRYRRENIADLGPVPTTMEARQGATLNVLGWGLAEAIGVTQRLARNPIWDSIALSPHCPTAAFPFGAEGKRSGPSDGVHISRQTRE
jgi:hypothetical protein